MAADDKDVTEFIREEGEVLRKHEKKMEEQEKLEWERVKPELYVGKAKNGMSFGIHLADGKVAMTLAMGADDPDIDELKKLSQQIVKVAARW